MAETVFVIPAEPVLSEVEGAGIQFFALDPCFRRGDIVSFCFPQQILFTLPITISEGPRKAGTQTASGYVTTNAADFGNNISHKLRFRTCIAKNRYQVGGYFRSSGGSRTTRTLIGQYLIIL